MQDVILTELRFSCAVLLGGEAVVPRFRIVTSEGTFAVFLPLPDDEHEKVRRMALIRGFMAWKMAMSFVLSSETKDPDGVMALEATGTDVRALWRPVVWTPLSLGPEQWLTLAQIGGGFPGLLPKGETRLDLETIAELERAFGPEGEFPAKLI